LTDFVTIFGRAPDATAFAPGRVNLIGEHTDYNGGLVLPMALELGTTVDVARREDVEVHAVTASVPDGSGRASYRRGGESRRGAWIDYVQGVTRALDDRGVRVSGFDLAIRSTLPLGAGLASSAALEVAVARGLRAAFALPLDDLAVAMTAHAAETGLVGAPVGVMDQMAASLGRSGEALLIDTRDLTTERVPMPPEASVIIIDSGIRHAHASGEYRTRREECERAARALHAATLSDVGVEDLPRVARLPEPLDRRARHVITENARVREAVAAMRARDVRWLGRLWTASHASMRDDFAVSLPEIDAIVEIALAEPGVFGARLTGGGFGGAVIVLAETGGASSIAERIRSAYHARTGRPGRVLAPLDTTLAR
jgi:galactokinase